MKNRITLENLDTFSVPLSSHPLNWKFKSENLTKEHKDQIIALNSKASRFLREFKQTQKYLRSTSAIEKYFEQVEELPLNNIDFKKMKKWLYNRGIPFDQKVFLLSESNWGFILTWKMLIKLSESIFYSSDDFIWDKTLNWCMIFDHEDVFVFGKNRNYNVETHSRELEEIQRMINTNNAST
ncbi:hypothetical protein LY01_01404 [Nonlabens xylanidelens]|uniref:Uncharacterized protein n=1 Tax=Nonlabens xylanidelens TaxID=191564 RepID=A0A2S6INQ6_9FLAO|nr:hypothetical protein [Nonlabens xylanidelens]PPK95811.1 hypothetical protein LY01_01404 [Nonlabens xylanidelens]PQJ22596.1 hypothetical protein BST94_03225 [Nonlabens xylanidelens]